MKNLLLLGLITVKFWNFNFNGKNGVSGDVDMVLMRAAQEKAGKGMGKGTGGIPVNDRGQNNLRAGYYVAVDIGTTTLSIEMYDSQGMFLAGKAEENAQRRLGSDVMMRLMHVQQGRGGELMYLIRNQIQDILGGLLQEIRPHEQKEEDVLPVRKMVLVGNTVMCHLFLGQDVSGLCGAPFQPAYRGKYCTRGSEIGWPEYSEMEILVLPGIAAHVGADAASVLGIQRLWQPDRIQLAIDLGTNAEILWNDHGQVYACSTASGPAFEGAGIACGSMAKPGAVSGVRIMKSNGNIVLDIISKFGKLNLPRGICGSGLIELVANLRQCGILQADGRMLNPEEGAVQGLHPALADRLEETPDGQYCFVLFDPDRDKINRREAEETACKKIYLSQEDVRAFQLAKAAIQAGIAVLCHETGRELSEIMECQIAGMFGYYISVKHAVACGLLPDLPEDRIRFLGNAAGRGAALALFDTDYVRELEQRVQQVKHIELAQNERFQSLYLQGMELKPLCGFVQ